MEKLSEYMQTYLPHVDKETIKSVIKAYKQWEVKKRGKFCEICDIELNDTDRSNETQFDFLFVCSKRREYANTFRSDLVRKELGIKPKDNLYDL